MDLFGDDPKVNTKATNKALKDLDKISGEIGKMKPVGLDAGGLTSSFNKKKNAIQIQSSAERAGLVSSIADQFLKQAGLTSDLRAKVAPGFSDLRAARLQEIENSRRAAIGNLRDNLARRRVLGSSFASDAETRAEIEFAQERDKVAAETFLQELDLSNKLIAQEFDLTRQSFGTKLSELNLQADVAAGLTAQASQVLQQSAALRAQLAQQKLSTTADLGIAQAKLDAESQSGFGSLIGKVAGTLLGPLGEAAGDAIAGAII
jgi:hypothetical protein